MKTTNKSILMAGSRVLGILIFPLQDIAVKWMGGSYPVLDEFIGIVESIGANIRAVKIIPR
jgi:hypothetical protein